jgi:uncharacterized repeat protein (TIGR01451 family)
MKKILLSTLILFGLITTGYSQPVCGGTFTDPAGATVNYSNDTNYTVTITPTNPGDVVTVTFTSFNTEATYDVLYVFNGNSTSSPLFASSNGSGNAETSSMPGGFWGTAIPGPFTSTDVSGCLTFNFRSDASVNNPGWIANVTCAPPPTCLRPINLTVSSITYNSAVVGWTDNNSATSWEVIAVPCGVPAPLASAVGQLATVNPFLMTGLSPLTCYDYYVRSLCSTTDVSAWAGPVTFTTPYQAPTCGGQFTDIGGAAGNYPNNSDTTTVICPDTANSAVTVTFTSFSTETGWDALYVYDGNSVSGLQIPSVNPAGNVPGGVAGGYWGTVNPGTFTSSDASGCLTFRFRSDASTNGLGWAANVTCEMQTSCLRPTAMTNTNTSTSITLDWTENNGAASWELLHLPCGSSPPDASTSGELVTSHPATLSGLTPGTCFDIYVRALCSSDSKSIWLLKSTFTSPVNDECANATVIPVNATSSCGQSVSGSITNATASVFPENTSCIGTPDDDTWFTFVATSSTLVCTIQNFSATPTTTNLNFRVYSGSCGSLTPFYCSTANSLSSFINNLVVGQTYYIQVYSNAGTPQTAAFNICITTPSICSTSQSVCGLNTYANSTGVASMGTIGCLFTTPNATFFNLRIAESGAINLQLSQTDFGGIGRDVDYAAWGPFDSKDAACAAVSSGQAPGIGVPVSLTTGCSYSTSAVEVLNIDNAVAGQFYIILVTNFSNQAGYISMVQTNINTAGAGSMDCSGIRLNAFIDTNSNGVRDNGEVNFPLGQFQYSINSSTDVHHITSPLGIHTIYDDFSSNAYNFSYVISPEFSSVYSSSATYSNVVVASGGMTTYNFPITSLQNYDDVGVTLLPLSSPRAGTTYQNKIIYTNNGNQAIASGNVTFDKNIPSVITTISQTGTTPTATGFTYNFTNLLPFESRSIIVTMSVPAIPTVSLGQLLTNTAAVDPVIGDYIATNNSSSLTQAVTGSYDPNDKSESHGGKILFSSFTDDDYFYYTIRFENTGTSGALNVSVTDILDDDLDENSLVMINASHTYTLDRVNKSLVWNFDNIQLPVSVANTDIGKGYINFKIKPKAGYALGDIIPNTASIYFDSNPAVVTNTFNTEFVQSLATQYYDFANLFVLSPVPVKNVLNITIKQTVIINSINIYNTLGQLVQVVNNPNQIIDVSGLQTGTYFIKILSDKGTASSKFLKE